MQDKLFIQTPAKINLFLKIINLRNDGYHNIRSGVTFLDLYDEMIIEISDTHSLKYTGPFKPLSNNFENDIVVKILSTLKLPQNIKLNINIKKNIPTQAGLGSASTNAAGLIKGLKNLGLIDKKGTRLLLNLGTDVQMCLYGKNCLITGKGDEIFPQINFPKYYFVLVKPAISLSTSLMYKKIKNYFIFDKQRNYSKKNISYITEKDIGNDFEKIAKSEYKEIANLLDFLSNTKDCIFARMTGSGSCCYAVYNKKEQAKTAIEVINHKFSNLWSYLGENNFSDN